MVFIGSHTPYSQWSAEPNRVRNINGLNYTVENLVTYDKTIAEKHKITFTAYIASKNLQGTGMLLLP
jgi:hypothetical protein